MQFNLRPASEDDREFLYALHCRTMRDVIEKTWGWDEAWQRRDFDRRFREYLTSIIECDGRPAGGLLLEWKPDSLYIHEIQLLPEYQSKGVGTEIIGTVIDQAAARRLPVTLSVVPANRRAQRLYERLGFEVTAIEAPFIRMRYGGDGQVGVSVMTVPTIRVARASDAEGIAQLTAQLGYDVTVSSVTQRLSRILPRQDQRFFVAEVDDHLVGWLHTAVAEFIESPAFVVIGGLVVDSNHRRKGIGRELIEHGEEWARKQGCSVVRLWSSSSRSASHQFYERLGYRNIKTQYSFLKALDATRDDDVGRFVPRV